MTPQRSQREKAAILLVAMLSVFPLPYILPHGAVTFSVFVVPIILAAGYYGLPGGLGCAALGALLALPAARRGGVTPWGPRLLSQVILYFLVGGFAGYMQGEQNRVRRILSRSSITDELTGLYNRRYFTARLDEEVRRAKRYGHPLSLLICDIDRFKRYNDAFGRANGDFVLNRIAGIIKESMRESDIPFRYGGDEFAIILPETGMESRQVAERIVSTVNSAFSGQSGDPSLRPRVAAGVAARDADQPLSAALLVSFADNALRKAKAAGAPYTLFRIGDQAGAGG